LFVFCALRFYGVDFFVSDGSGFLNGFAVFPFALAFCAVSLVSCPLPFEKQASLFGPSSLWLFAVHWPSFV
jgi:hypothetical protein